MPENTPAIGLLGTQATCRALGIERKSLFRWSENGLIAPLGQLEGPNGAFVWAADDVHRLAAELAELAQLSRAELARLAALDHDGRVQLRRWVLLTAGGGES